MQRFMTTILTLSALVICSCGKSPQGKESSLSPEHASTLQSYAQDQNAGTVSELMAYTSVPEAISALLDSSDGRTELASIAQGARTIAFDGKSNAAHIVTRS
jgi:hypothetical protein